MKLKKVIIKIKKLNNINTSSNTINSLFALSSRLIYLQKLKIKNYISLDNTFFKKRTPFFLVRKNFKKYFNLFLLNRSITPNLLKFLHILFFPKNTDAFWKHYYPINLLEFKKLKYNKEKFAPLNSFSYYIALIFKNNYIKNIYYLSNNSESTFINKLKYLYYLTFLNRDNVLSLQNSAFLSVDHEKKNFKNFFILSFKEKSYLQKIVQFYYPIFSILIKEQAIHSLPMKTKKPRRV